MIIISLIKVTYKDKETIIQAKNLNDIQDAIIALEEAENQGGTTGAVLYTEQTLTEAQKATARDNIGAATVEEVLEAIPVAEGASY